VYVPPRASGDARARLIRDLRRRDKLPRLVVVALGSNGVITKGNIRDALDIVGKKRTLGLVAHSAGHSAWFQPDGLHLTFEDADAMALLFAKVLKPLPPPHNAR